MPRAPRGRQNIFQPSVPYIFSDVEYAPGATSLSRLRRCLRRKVVVATVHSVRVDEA